jgi:hypothetical protein
LEDEDALAERTRKLPMPPEDEEGREQIYSVREEGAEGINAVRLLTVVNNAECKHD